MIDYFRSRPDAEFIPIDHAQAAIRLPAGNRETALAVDILLEEMEREHPELAPIVELKCFLNPTNDEAAKALGMSVNRILTAIALAARVIVGVDILHAQTNLIAAVLFDFGIPGAHSPAGTYQITVDQSRGTAVAHVSNVATAVR